MKEYPQVNGPSKAPNEQCIAFYKYDGSNLRFEWSKKRGWHKFGARHTMIDESSPVFGEAISIFKNKYGDDLARIFTDNKSFKGIDSFIVFCEFFGPNSFAGLHDPNDKKDVILFDVNPLRKNILSPRDFIKYFSSVEIAEVIYEGNFSKQFIRDVWDGKYPVNEGVVAKGVLNNKVWMAKAKTKSWLDKLKDSKNTDLSSILLDNLKEQNF